MKTSSQIKTKQGMNIPLRVALKNIYKLQQSNNNNNSSSDNSQDNDNENNNNNNQNNDTNHSIDDNDVNDQEINNLHEVTQQDEENLINELKYRAYYIMLQLNPSLQQAKPDTEVLKNLQFIITQNKYYNKIIEYENKVANDYNIKNEDVLSLQKYLDQQLLTTNELYNAINAALPLQTVKISLIKLFTRKDIIPTTYKQITLLEKINAIKDNLHKINYTDEQLKKIITLYYDKNKDLTKLDEFFVFDFLDENKINEVIQIIEEYESEVNNFQFKNKKMIVCGAGLEYVENNNNNNNNVNGDDVSNLGKDVIVTFSEAADDKKGAVDKEGKILKKIRITDKMWNNLVNVSKHMQGLVVDVNQGDKIA